MSVRSVLFRSIALGPVQPKVIRASYWLIIIALVIATTQIGLTAQSIYLQGLERNAEYNHQVVMRSDLLKKYAQLAAAISSAKQTGVNVEAIEAELKKIKASIFSASSPIAITAQINSLHQQLTEAQNQHAAELEKQQLGSLVGTVRESSSPIAQALLVLSSSAGEVAKVEASSNGSYSFSVKAGSYSLAVSKAGYLSQKKAVTINAQQETKLDLTLSKPTPKAPTTTSASNGDSNGDSSYAVETVIANSVSYTVHVAKFNLGSGQFRVVTDTANDDDCSDDCPVKSLSGYLSSNGGFAGMNGTYFCPADYSSCVNETGAFFWKVLNTRLNKMINQNNGLGETSPFLAFKGNEAKYFSSWNSYMSSDYNATAGVNSYPPLVVNGSNVVGSASLDDKQRTTKSNRGAIGYKGQTLYLIIGKSATVVDMGAITAEWV